MSAPTVTYTSDYVHLCVATWHFFCWCVLTQLCSASNPRVPGPLPTFDMHTAATPVECARANPPPRPASTQLLFNQGDLEALRSAWANLMAAWTHTFDSMHFWAAFPFEPAQLQVIVRRLHEAGFVCVTQFTRRPVDEQYYGDFEMGFYVFLPRSNQPLVRSYRVQTPWFEEDQAAVHALQQRLLQARASGDRTFSVDSALHPYTDAQMQAIALQLLKAGYVLVNLGGDPVDLDTPYHYINGFTVFFKVRKLDLK